MLYIKSMMKIILKIYFYIKKQGDRPAKKKVFSVAPALWERFDFNYIANYQNLYAIICTFLKHKITINKYLKFKL